jgi:hypothetical protein
MPRYAELVPVPSAKKAAPPPGARRPPPQHTGPQRGAIWHAIQLKAAQDAAAAAAAPRPMSQSGFPGALKAGVEALSGLAMDDVRVHRNSPEPAKLGALAYAQGSDIHLGPGQERHLPHEAWHIVQQKQGRVQATAQMKGVAINADAGLEADADRMGAMLNSVTVQPGSPVQAASVAQRVLQLQRLEAEPRRPTSGAWTDGDFVHHYYFGKGAAVDLQEIGLSDMFRNHASVRQKVDEFVALTFAQPASVTSFQKNAITDVTDKIFSVGHSTFFRVASRGSSHWGFHFSIRDSFKDPISMGFELGGTPFPINFGWTETRPRTDKQASVR